MIHQTDYLAVAQEWHRRGFFTTPVKPGAKHPRLNDWNTHPAKNLSVAQQHAFDYPHDDVGLVSTRGVGHFCWLDIDHRSVEDRIFRATGLRLPKTLTTLSRPKTAAWKTHLCFRQTAYSVSHCRTEMTGIRDFTMTERDDKGRVPNLFDVKGCGGGGFVVAGGCCRQIETPDGLVNEQYTADDAPIIDIPDWLVDWLLAEYRKFRSEDAKRIAAEAELTRTMKSALTSADTELRGVMFEYDPTKDFLSIDAKGGALIPKEYRNGFLKSLGGELATRGIPRNQTERMLQIAAEICEPFEDDERDKAIQSIINRLRIGNVWIGRAQIRDAEKPHVTGDVTGNSKSLLSVLRHAAKGLPWDSGNLSSHFVNERLRNAAKCAGVVCESDGSWKKAVSRALAGIGAKSKKSRSPSGRLVWVWSMENQEQNQNQDQPQAGTHNVVTCHWSNKDLAAFEPPTSPLKNLFNTQEESL
jgi:Bifunctional DNA primase/polymerase, N-terminal